MKRYGYVCDYWDECGANAGIRETEDGDYVLHSEAQAEVDAVRAKGMAWMDKYMARRGILPTQTIIVGAKVTPTIDLDKECWADIKRAVDDSKWIPKEYAMSDWVSDVCHFLREGPESFLPK